MSATRLRASPQRWHSAGTFARFVGQELLQNVHIHRQTPASPGKVCRVLAMRPRPDASSPRRTWHTAASSPLGQQAVLVSGLAVTCSKYAGSDTKRKLPHGHVQQTHDAAKSVRERHFKPIARQMTEGFDLPCDHALLQSLCTKPGRTDQLTIFRSYLADWQS